MKVIRIDASTGITEIVEVPDEHIEPAAEMPPEPVDEVAELKARISQLEDFVLWTMGLAPRSE